MKAFAFALIVFLNLCFTSSVNAAASTRVSDLFDEEGIPVFTNYLPDAYDANVQNWAITQTPQGMIYVGNTDGVLEFDGVDWRLISVANATIARSLAVDPESGRVYVGAVGELGYLQADKSGNMQFVSLIDLIEPEHREFADVWQTFHTEEGVYFSTFQRLFLYKNNKIQVWNTEQGFHFSFQVGNRIFIREIGKGLLELIDGKLTLVKGTERFADERIYGVIAHPTPDSSDLLIATRTQGLFIHSGDGLVAWNTPIDQFLNNDLIYAVDRLPNERIAISTLQGGIYIIDNQSNWISQLNAEDGLPDNVATSLFVDNEEGIWLSSTNGLSRIQPTDALTQFNKTSGLARGALSLQRFNGHIYVCSDVGVLRLEPGPNPVFKPVEGIQYQTWSIVEAHGHLLAGNYLGLYEIKDNTAEQVLPFDTVFSIYPSASTNKVFVGLRNGLAIVSKAQSKWVEEKKLEGIDHEIRSIVEDKDGSLWLGTYTRGVIKISDPFSSNFTVQHFTTEHGLPSNNTNIVDLYNNKPIFLTLSGVYTLDESNNSFKAIETPSDFHQQHNKVYQVGLSMRTIDGDFTWRKKTLQNLNNYNLSAMLVEPNDIYWFAGIDGLFRVDFKQQSQQDRAFDITLRKVTAGDGQVIFGGGGIPANYSMPFEDNRLRFEFAALTFNAPRETSYQVKLIGADKQWSPATTESFMDYSNLWEGDYELWVRAKNNQGIQQESKIYHFTVLAPWYRSYFAYFCYLIISVGGIWGIVYWRSARLLAQKKLLRKQVEERTKQLAMLGQIGRDITASLDLDDALESVYNSINTMLDASVFGIGLYQPEEQRIEFRLAIENGQRYKPYFREMSDKNQLAVWCIENKDVVYISDFSTEYSRYLPDKETHTVTLEDGTQTKKAVSMLYVPILLKDTVVGVLSVQSFEKHAYRRQHVKLLQTLASYTAIAIDNSQAHEELMLAYKTAEEISITDQLTGLKNRHFLNQYIDSDINKINRDYENCRRNNTLNKANDSVHIFFIIDLDHFKQVNDTYGHAAGDMVLVQMKTLLTDIFRDSDFLVRWGGEEFLSIARFTKMSCGEVLAERVRSSIEQHPFDIGDGKSIKMSASIGFASYPFINDNHLLLTWQDVVKIADQCLYFAKNNSRNAWVGGHENESISHQTLLDMLQTEPQDLVQSKVISSSTSIKSLQS